MIFLEVKKEDCKTLAEFLGALRVVMDGKPNIVSMAQFIDGLRWLQECAKDMAKSYSTVSQVTEDSKPVNKSPNKEGWTIKEYHPGSFEP